MGFGSQKFTSETGSAELTMGTAVLRAQIGAYYKTPTSAFELAFFGIYDYPLIQEYTGNAGNTSEVSGGMYAQFGIEGTVYFGDFKPPKKNKGKKKKK